MKEFIENLISRLEELRNDKYVNGVDRFTTREKRVFDIAEEIVNLLAEEYKQCIKSSCSNCETYDKEKHYCPKWCDVIKGTVAEMDENRWIPCSERLPEPIDDMLQCVIVTDENDWQGMAYYHPQKGWVFAECHNSDRKIDWTEIIAWQPLPPAYVSEEGRG